MDAANEVVELDPRDIHRLAILTPKNDRRIVGRGPEEIRAHIEGGVGEKSGVTKLCRRLDEALTLVALHPAEVPRFTPEPIWLGDRPSVQGIEIPDVDTVAIGDPSLEQMQIRRRNPCRVRNPQRSVGHADHSTVFDVSSLPRPGVRRLITVPTILIGAAVMIALTPLLLVLLSADGRLEAAS